jgi:hypothetical protein
MGKASVWGRHGGISDKLKVVRLKKEDIEMRNALRFLLIFIGSVLPLLSQPNMAESAEPGEIVVAEERFVDNGDGTVTDTRRKIMWQKGDNGKEVTFPEAQEYCKTLRLGGHDDWRLPKPEEGETAVVVELMMPIHSPDTYARFDLYWSSDSTVLIPFNYRPSHGVQVSRIYPARAGGRAFVRAVRSLGATEPHSDS